MIEPSTPDRLDDLLTGYFRPDMTPADLATRIARSARAVGADLGELGNRLAIQATPHGVSLIRTGRLEQPASAVARRLAERAREEIVEYLRGKRAFFSVPVDLSEAGAEAEGAVAGRRDRPGTGRGADLHHASPPRPRRARVLPGHATARGQPRRVGPAI